MYKKAIAFSHRNNLLHLIKLIRSREQRLPRMHFDQNTAQTPHIDRNAVGQSEHNLRTPIKSTLNVRIHPSTGIARASKVNDFDPASFGVSKEYVLGLQIAMDDVDVRSGEVGQCLEYLFGEFANEVEGDSGKVRVFQEFVEIEG
jgi:hypothetical protein